LEVVAWGVAPAGWAPLRWCLFAEPVHVYRESKVRLEAVLANEDVLPPDGLMDWV
jgi:hypothetical protein